MHSTQSSSKFGMDIGFLKNEWKSMFNRTTMVPDIWAGITVALVALPLNLALAIAAGVEPGVGITTGIIAGVVAAIFGGQRFAITGPAAAMAVILIEVSQAYGISGIWFVCLMAGLMQVGASLLKQGKLVSYIPMPVMVGFANAIGGLVFFNALENFLGLPTRPLAAAGKEVVENHPMIPELLVDLSELNSRVFIHNEINAYALLIGIVALALALLTPKVTKAIPGQLVAIVGATLLVALLGLDIPKIGDISSIPQFLPMPSIPSIPWDKFGVLFPTAITVFVLGSIESLLSATVADGMTMSKKHHSNQELMGQGIANLVVPFFGGIPVTGVIARTAVNIRAGARTRLSAIVHSFTLMALIFFFAKYAEQIPLSALAAILILTGIRLVEWHAIKQIWRASRFESYVVLATTLVSIMVDLTAGVIVGLLFTCGLFIRQMSDLKLVAADDSAATADPKIAELPLCKFVRTYLIDGPLFFGAAERFVENIMVVDNIKAIILHMRAVSVMDLTGVETLLSVQNQLKRQGARLVIAELPAQPRQLLERTGAAEKLGAENIFSSYQEAVLDTNKKVLESECQGCKGAKDSKYPPPKDCKLRIAMLDPSNPIGRQIEQYGQQVHTVEKQSGMEWLVPVRVPEEIPNCLRDTPISALLQSHNLGLMDVKNSAAAELVVGMCIDFRKSLRMPKELAFTIRREGANMDGAEFSVALAISKGIRHMALIAHNQCAMANTASQRDDFISTLCQQHGWTIDRAQSFFDDHVRSRNIGNEIDFVMEESTRIEKLFPGLQVVPMLYRVEDTRLYLIHEWFMTHAPDDPIARELQAQSQTTEMKRVEV